MESRQSAKTIRVKPFSKEKLDYLHQNPVEVEIVDHAEDYLYSSARDYAGKKGLLNIEFSN